MNRTQHTQLHKEFARSHEELEELVQKRTAELQEIGEQVHREIGEQKGLKLHEALDMLEKQLILNALEQHHWHRGKTAESLGIPRRSLQRKMNKYGLMAG